MRADWQRVPLRRVSLAMCDGPFGSDLKSSHYADSGVRVIRLQNIGANGFDATDAAYISAEYFRSLHGHDVETGDLLVAGLGDDNHLVGRACVYPEGMSTAMVKADCFRFRLDRDQVEPRFVAYAFAAKEVRAQLDQLVRGSTRMRVNLRSVAAVSLTVPPLPGQRRIADFLDARCAAIDAAIEKKTALLDLTADRKLAMQLTELGASTSQAPRKRTSLVAWLESIPSHWHETKIRHVARLESGHTPSRQHPEYWVLSECTIPWFSLADVWQLRNESVDYVSNTSEKISQIGLANSSARLLPAGTVMLSRTASVGFSAIAAAPMATTQDFANWICGPRLLPEFLLECFRSMRQEWARLTMGSTHKTIYMPELEDLRVPLPPLDEQRMIVNKLVQVRASTRDLTRSVMRSIVALREYRTALITAAVTGQLDLPSAPTDPTL